MSKIKISFIIMLFLFNIMLGTAFAAECDCGTEYLEDWDSDEDPFFEIIDADYHQVFFWQDQVCAECETKHQVKYKQEPDEKEAHEFRDGETKCKWCEYEKNSTQPQQPTDCKHDDPTKITTKDAGQERKLIDGNTEKHQLIIKVQQYCDGCQKTFGEVTVKSSEEEAHSFDATGKCICGYMKPEEKCEHNDKNKIIDASTIERISDDEEYHNVIAREKCTNCDTFINEKPSVKETHNFNGGDTCVCGYVKIVQESELSKAIKFLEENDIMIGDENGDFRPNDAMTRAEYAKIVCNYVGDNINYIYDKKDFEDVSLNHWAYEYISKASQAGLLLGYGDDVFGIEDTLTEEQAITVICRMIGNDVETIEKFAKAAGGYWQGYSTVSEKRGIKLENKISERIPASRARVAKWLYQLYNINTSK